MQDIWIKWMIRRTGVAVKWYVPIDYKWTGIIGKSGSRLDKIGFIFIKIVYTFTHKHLAKETLVQRLSKQYNFKINIPIFK